MEKRYVKVLLETDESGKKKPRSITIDDREYSIDRVLDVRNCSSFKSGGFGERYTVRICGHERYLFFEDGRWFLE